TVDTDLSRPFHKFVPEHKLFSKEKSSQFLINIIKNQTPTSTGKFIAWDSSEIPW
ncbi:MAG: short-chain dehydrogenase, partial [Prochlorococcus sp. MED105]|nr:short-chain dehydrogenase [Prochlorococcus sp. MED105]